MRLWRSRLTGRQSERLLEHFVAGTSARAAAELTGVNRNTARLYYHRLRQIIVRNLEERAAVIEASGIGRAGKLPVFALVKEGRQIHVVLLQNVPCPALSPASASAVRPDAVVYADTTELPAALDVSRFRHERVRYRPRMARARAAIDNVENFWSQAKRQLRRYNGIPRRHLPLFLKECEWRFNFGSPRQLKKTLTAWIRAGARKA